MTSHRRAKTAIATYHSQSPDDPKTRMRFLVRTNNKKNDQHEIRGPPKMGLKA